MNEIKERQILAFSVVYSHKKKLAKVCVLQGEEGCLEDRADMERGVIAGNLYRYFVPNISEYMKNFMKAGNNTITKRRATCHTMPF